MTPHVHYAGPRTRHLGFLGRAIAFVYRRSGRQSFTPATNADPWLRPDGNTPPDLTLRAHRIHNRSPKAAAVYLRQHLILSRGRFSK